MLTLISRNRPGRAPFWCCNFRVSAMGHVNQIKPENLSDQQFDVVLTKLMGLCDRMCDGQVLDLADALHEVIRSRQRIRCEHAHIGGGLRLAEPRAF